MAQATGESSVVRELPTESESGFARGGVIFAATVMFVVGVFQALQGVVAILDDDFFSPVSDYTYDLDVTTWGWIHLIAGVVVAVSGLALFAARRWAAIIAIALAVMSAVSNFFFIPYFPIWSLVSIGLALWVIWALTRPRVLEEL